MLVFGEQLKLWAIIVALGGTFSFEVLELRLLKGEITSVIKQVLYILSAFAGAHTGYILLNNLGVSKLWKKGYLLYGFLF